MKPSFMHSRLRFLRSVSFASTLPAMLSFFGCSGANRSEQHGAADTLIGNWKRVDWPNNDIMEDVWVDLTFTTTDKIDVRYRPANLYIGMLSPPGQKAALTRIVDRDGMYELLGDGKMRIEIGGSASTYAFDIKNDKLYLGSPSSELEGSRTLVYARTA